MHSENRKNQLGIFFKIIMLNFLGIIINFELIFKYFMKLSIIEFGGLIPSPATAFLSLVNLEYRSATFQCALIDSHLIEI